MKRNAMRRMVGMVVFTAVSTLCLARSVVAGDAPKVTLKRGDHVCLIGNTLAERTQYFGHFETLLHAQFPQLQLVVRDLGFSADEVKLRSRLLDFGTPDEHLTLEQADVLFAFFGFNESFAGKDGLPQFEKDLAEFIEHTQGQKYNGHSPPRLVLFSPIAHENLGDPNLPDGYTDNARIALYTEAMKRVAAEHNVPFVDLFDPSRKLMQSSEKPLTFNGIHFTDSGYRRFAPVMMQALFGTVPRLSGEQYEKLRAEVNEKCFQFFHRYRAVNGYYIYGPRSKVWNNAAVMENERKKLDEMCAIRDRRIWDVAQGKSVPENIDDSSTRPYLKVESNFKQPIKILPPEESKKLFHLADGYAVNLFAGEVEFPDLQNPVQLTFDTKGRLWVCTMPSYPMYQPPHKPDDKLLILEDTDGDGRADKQTVFAHGLHVPTGFELGDGGVYIAQQPNLMFLKDTDGDDRADVRRLILHGFGSGDTHHAIGAFTWGPGGGLYMHEGTFLHASVETPYGPVRNAHGGIYRFDPTTWKFETFVHYNFANPWGHAFDRWGQDFVADASGGANYFATAFSGKAPQFTGQEDFGPFKFQYRAQMKQFFPKRVRPTAGCEIVSSRNFPPEAQGNYLLNNVIGFQGILQHTVTEDGSGFVGKEIEPLLFSSDPNFRPTDLQFGPDGALYVIDWFNPLIGHLQHSLRDPNRDHMHGRIWRITYSGRPLVKPPKIDGQPIPALLDLLKTYENRTRYRVRLELRERPTAEVVEALNKWIAGLDPNDPDYEHHLLEALWVHQHHNAVDETLLKRVLRSPDYHARAAATRVLCFWRDQVSHPLELLQVQANDEQPRVRLEAVRACSFFEDPQAAAIALQILKYPMDYYLDYTLQETMRTLEPYWKPAVVAGQTLTKGNPKGTEYILNIVTTEDLVAMARSRPVYEELLHRPGVAGQFREEALRGLAKLNHTDAMTELMAAIGRLDASDSAHAQHVLTDLAGVFTKQPADQVARFRSRIEDFAHSARLPITRQASFVALMMTDHSAENVWPQAVQSVKSLRDFVDAVPLIPDDKLRSSLYDRLEPLLDGLPESLAKKAAGQKGSVGRYVRIELPGSKRTLTLAEVEVISDGRNVAIEGKARQSSTAFGGMAERAIDGNTSGRYGDGGQTHTKEDRPNPWWEVDLLREQPIDSINVFNRSENNGQYTDRLDGFTITVLDANRRPVFTRKGIPAPRESVSVQLEGDPASVIRRAAVNAVTYIPGREQEVFRKLADFVKHDVSRSAAVRGLGRIPRNKLPQDEVRPLIDSLLTYIQSVPLQQRTRTEVVEAIQLGKRLAMVRPKDEAKALFTQLRKLGIDVFIIRPLPHKIQYDRTNLFVEAGKPFEIRFENIDIMPHNLVITAPGAREEVGMLAEQMGSTPEAFALQFIPRSDKILDAIGLLQPGQEERLRVTAPTQLGDYPYVCTFPGHWRTMYGTLHVVSDVSEIPLEQLEAPERIAEVPTRPFVRKWQARELAASLSQLDAGRSYENGKHLFETIACAKCHQVRGKGAEVGPDLTKLPEKFADGKMDRNKLLTEVIEPSKVIDEKFLTQVIVTDEGRVVSGVIVHEDENTLKLMANPLDEDTQPQLVRKDTILQRTTSKVSLMPESLLNTLSREEILDLLAYIANGGDPKASAFRNGRQASAGDDQSP